MQTCLFLYENISTAAFFAVFQPFNGSLAFLLSIFTSMHQPQKYNYNLIMSFYAAAIHSPKTSILSQHGKTHQTGSLWVTMANWQQASLLINTLTTSFKKTPSLHYICMKYLNEYALKSFQDKQKVYAASYLSN